jgi:hypothetical protein
MKRITLLAIFLLFFGSVADAWAQQGSFRGPRFQRPRYNRPMFVRPRFSMRGTQFQRVRFQRPVFTRATYIPQTQMLRANFRGPRRMRIPRFNRPAQMRLATSRPGSSRKTTRVTW